MSWQSDAHNNGDCLSFCPACAREACCEEYYDTGRTHHPDCENYDPTPCCPDPDCPGRGAGTCTFPGYANNH